MRKTTKKRRRRAALLLILLITGIAVLLKSGIVTKRIQREETKKAVAAEVEALHEKRTGTESWRRHRILILSANSPAMRIRSRN